MSVSLKKVVAVVNTYSSQFKNCECKMNVNIFFLFQFHVRNTYHCKSLLPFIARLCLKKELHGIT